MDTTATAVRRRVEAFRERCRALGLALTPQRLAVYERLAAAADHPCAEDLFRALKRKLPALSLATVYRTLERLEANGLIRRVPGIDDPARFDADVASHHHLICRACGAVRDVSLPAFEALALPAEVLAGFAVEGRHAQFVGVCRDCAARRPVANDS